MQPHLFRLPSMSKRCGASAPKPAYRAFHVSISRGDKAEIIDKVFVMSVETPTYLPYPRDDAKGLATAINAQPCLVNSAPYAIKNGLLANKDRFMAPQSWRKPGTVYSPVLTAPPATVACSNTPTFQPRAAKCKAAAKCVVAGTNANCVELGQAFTLRLFYKDICKSIQIWLA